MASSCFFNNGMPFTKFHYVHIIYLLTNWRKCIGIHDGRYCHLKIQGSKQQRQRGQTLSTVSRLTAKYFCNISIDASVILLKQANRRTRHLSGEFCSHRSAYFGHVQQIRCVYRHYESQECMTYAMLLGLQSIPGGLSGWVCGGATTSGERSTGKRRNYMTFYVVKLSLSSQRMTLSRK